MTMFDPSLTPQFDFVTLSAGIRRDAWRLNMPHAERAPVLYLLTKGQGRVMMAGKTRGFQGPTVLFAPAHTMLSFHMAGPVFGTKLRLPQSFSSVLPTEPVFVRTMNAQVLAEVTQLVGQLEAESKSQALGWETAARGYTTLLGVHLIRLAASAQEQAATETKAEKLVTTFTSMVEEDLVKGNALDGSVSVYADRLGITPTHLTRVCREVSGHAASTLLQDRVLSEARRLLADTPTPIKDIADRLGFTSAAYFSRAFGQRMGMTPRDARREASGIQALAS